MASEQLAKVLEMIKAVPRDPTASVGRMRGAMEKLSEHVARDVKCEAVSAGGVPAEWIVAPFPAAVDDATAAYRWLLAQGYKPGKIVISGDSAGGGLALATLIALRDANVA